MSDATTVWLVRTRFGLSSWQEFIHAAKAKTSWNDKTELHAYDESVKECRLIRTKLSDYKPPDDGWEGRIFGGDCELRWLRSGSQYRVWLVVEREKKTEDKELVEVQEQLEVIPIERRYYLHGEYDGTDKETGQSRFIEGRYPGKVFEYPVAPEETEQDKGKKDRAYILVREYLAKQPDWSKPRSMDEVQDALNREMLVEHRFVGVGVGKGAHEPKEDV